MVKFGVGVGTQTTQKVWKASFLINLFAELLAIVLVLSCNYGLGDHGKIVQGKFELEATAGKKRVSITATKEAENVDPDMGMAPRISYIPHRFNTATELTVEVTADGPNNFDFELTAQ